MKDLVDTSQRAETGTC